MTVKPSSGELFSVFQLLKNPGRVISITRIFSLWARTYFGAQSKVKLSEATITELHPDDRIPPEEHAIYPYLFASVYIAFVVKYFIDKISNTDFKSACEAYKEMIFESEKVFLSRPTRMKDRLRVHHSLTLFMHTLDGPTNGYPSLHVGLTTLSYFIMNQGLRSQANSESLMAAAMRQTCIDICRSTLKTKQHSIIDVIGGLFLAENTYQNYFQGKGEDLLPEILPELSPYEIEKLRSDMSASSNLTQLLTDLLATTGSFEHSILPS